MDCNNTITFIKEWNRMCDSYDSECRYCPLEECKTDIEDCLSWVCNEKNIKTAIEIVREWSNENPPKTYFSVLKEHYPLLLLDEFGMPRFCVNDLYGEVCDCDDIYKSCARCWNMPI